jgi:hypothetical protein
MDLENNGARLINDFSAVLKDIGRSWQVLRQTEKTWNLKKAQQQLDKIKPLLNQLADNWPLTEAALDQLTEDISQQVARPDYIQELESELLAAGVNFSGDFPSYLLPPFNLQINLESFEARLSMGRKNERISDLNPQILAQWVAKRYKTVLGRRFNAGAFMKDLINAYQLATQLKFREKNEKWGVAVPIKDIYDLMTIRAAARRDYPRQFFTFDLGLLKEEAELQLGRHRFELGFARNPSRAMTIVDSSGRESHISSLTIYLDEGDPDGTRS